MLLEETRCRRIAERGFDVVAVPGIRPNL